MEQAIASVGILVQDPPNSLDLIDFQVLPGQTCGSLRALSPGSIDPATGYYIPNSADAPNPTTAVPEPSEVLGTLFFGAIGVGYLLKRQSCHNLAKRTEQY